MCMDYKKNCACGKKWASFHFKDPVIPYEIVTRLYCPECSGDVEFEPAQMVNDNNWYISYDMERAQIIKNNVSVPAITPEYLFDEGYCTWNGIYPTDIIDSVKEREQITQLAKTDPRKYLEAIKAWGISRMERLAAEGWRKAREGNSVSV